VLLIDLDPQANATSSLGIDKYGVKKGTYEVLLGQEPIAPQILFNPKLKINLLPASPSLAGAKWNWIEMPKREFCLREALNQSSIAMITFSGLVHLRSASYCEWIDGCPRWCPHPRTM